jgi:hypothetical protein
MTTRKDFIAAAAKIAALPDLATRTAAAIALASVFAASNPAFNRQKFLIACRADL